MNLGRYKNLVECAIEESGVLAEVTFLRINVEQSEPADDFYNERDESEKVYDRFTINAIVEENPRRNIYGPGGGEVIADLMVTWYGEKGYVPDEADHIEWRDDEYEVTKVERVMPFGKSSQFGWTVTGTRFS